MMVAAMRLPRAAAESPRVLVRSAGVAEGGHQLVELTQADLAADGLPVAVRQHPIGGVADGLVAGRGGVVEPGLLVDEDAVRDRIVGRPGIPHGGGHVIEVAGVHRGGREVTADGIEQSLVPEPGHGLAGIGAAHAGGGVDRFDRRQHRHLRVFGHGRDYTRDPERSGHDRG